MAGGNAHVAGMIRSATTLLLFSLGLTLLAPGCCHLAEGSEYDPCADLEEGDECQLCAPDDPDCVETAVIKLCDAEGECGSRDAVDVAHDGHAH